MLTALLLAASLLASVDTTDLAPRIHRVAVAPGETLRVTVAGPAAGRPVVLVPGLFGSAFGFRHVVARLVAQGARTVVVEPLGVGGSARPPKADYSLTRQAARISAALDSLHVRGAVLVAHGVGGGMAFRVAVTRPELVRGLVGLEAGPAERAASAGLARAVQFVPWVKMMGGARLIRSRIGASLKKESHDPAWVTEAVIDAYTADAAADLDGTLLALVRMSESREPEKLGPRLRELRVPVRMLIGEKEGKSRPAAGDLARLRVAVPALVVDTVRGSGHYLHEERPQAVADAILGLLGAPSDAAAATVDGDPGPGLR